MPQWKQLQEQMPESKTRRRRKILWPMVREWNPPRLQTLPSSRMPPQLTVSP
jgi:hypothetical protein